MGAQLVWTAKNRSGVFALLVALGVTGGSTLTYCPPVFAENKSQAAALEKFGEGREAFETGRFEEALIAFKASIELLPSPNTSLYIARCHRALGQVASAYTNFKMASQVAQDRLQASGEKRYEKTRDTAASEAAEIEAEVPWLTLAVPSDVPIGFSIRLDGEDVPTSVWGAAVPTDPGKHVVTATGSRLQPFQQEFDLATGEKKRVEVKLERLPTATVKLSFGTKPAGLAVQLDGKAVSPSELEAERELDIGKHAIVVSAPGYLPFKWQKSLRDGDEQIVKVVLQADELARGAGGGGTPPWLFFTAAGVGAVALGAGTYFAIQAKSDSDAQQELDPLTRDPAVKDDIKSTASTANTLFIAGGLVVAGAGVLFFTTDWGKDEPSRGQEQAGMRVSPWVSPLGAGVGAEGRF